MRVAIFAPTRQSLYSIIVTYLLCLDSDIEITAIFIRSVWNLKRVQYELKFDSLRLIKKIIEKYILRDRNYNYFGCDNLLSLAKQINLPGDSLTDIANLYGLNIFIVKDYNDLYTQKLLLKNQPDVIVFTGGGLIRRPILEIPRLGVLNCHMGILPQYRGMDVAEWAIAEENLSNIGVTLHFMDEGIDTGPILLKKKLKIVQFDNIRTISAKLEYLMVNTVIEGINGLKNCHLSPTTQDFENGRQYFVMHPRLRKFVERKLLLKFKHN